MEYMTKDKGLLELVTLVYISMQPVVTVGQLVWRLAPIGLVASCEKYFDSA